MTATPEHPDTPDSTPDNPAYDTASSGVATTVLGAAGATTPDDRATRRAWWIAGGIATGAMLLFALIFAGVWLWAVPSAEERRSHTEEYTQELRGVDVSVEVGSIDLVAADGTALEVQRELVWRGSEPEITEEWRGTTFTADGDCDDSPRFWFNVDGCKVAYTLHVPSGTDAEADTDVGEVWLDGLDGAIDVETSVGDIRGEELRATSVTAETGVGTIELAFDEVRGDIRIDIGTGDVELVLPDDGTTFAIDYDTGVGSQNIDIATDASAKADYVITVKIGVGDLSVRYG